MYVHCFMFQPLSLSCVPVTETELLHRSPSRATRVWIVFLLYNYYFFCSVVNVKNHFPHCLIFSFLCYLCVCRRKTNYKSQPFFVHMLVNWLKYLSLLLGIGVDRGRWEEKKMKKKPYISVSSSDGLDAYRVILVTYISAAYITEQLKRNNGVTFAPCFLVVFMCGTKV